MNLFQAIFYDKLCDKEFLRFCKIGDETQKKLLEIIDGMNPDNDIIVNAKPTTPLPEPLPGAVEVDVPLTLTDLPPGYSITGACDPAVELKWSEPVDDDKKTRHTNEAQEGYWYVCLPIGEVSEGLCFKLAASLNC